ncbi:hypothetical protein U0C82_14820 [Fulvimarina sp. 2208YS6-2-32]|uniref:Nonstructural protein n=1 Tax=Fulvimarina uroteuthidis TaxID=3098149 RepID=A0ABU5I4V3_9HYPH|nr:hypothetical protein [Fulvimarina sp. 2208YS6-2-32]MDY8110413.1 hypothetical protein [Fulvimarina sp. 2208YS6-2-32]
MTEKTYFIVQAFEKKGRRLVAAQPTQCRSEAEAIGRAERDARRFTGVVAFRQVADDETGEVVDEPVFLARYGDLPQELSDE